VVTVEAGATLIIQGDLTNNNNSTSVKIDGTLQVNGNIYADNGSNFQGSGTVNSTGAIIPSGGNQGTIFGQVVSCSTGPCSGNTCASNTLSASPTVVCNSGSSTITASALGTGYTAKWQSGPSTAGPFTDISGATSQNYTTPVITTTTYYRRYITNGTCQAYSAPVGITVNTLSSVAASSNSPVCAGATINLTATTLSGATYSWTGPNSFTSTSQNPSITIANSAKAGTYTLTVTIPGCGTNTLTTTVVVGTAIGVTAGGSTPICSGNSINLTATTITSATYSWTGPNSFTSTSQNPSIAGSTTAMSGTYTVVATRNGCSATSSRAITVNQTPSVTAGSNSPVCSGNTINLTATTFAGATYSWSGPLLFSSTSQNPSTSASVLSAGTYTVTATANGCSASSSTVVSVNLTPTVTTSSNTPVCSGNSINLSASSSVGGATFSWSGPSSYTSSTQNPTITNATTAMSGTYSVSVSVSGCLPVTSSTSVTVNSTPSAPTVTTPVTYCQGSTASALTATGTNLLWYTVSSGGTGSSTAPTPSTASVGTTSYYVSQTSSGCESSRATINVVVNATPSAPTVTTPVTYCRNATASALTATGTNLLWYTVSSGGTGSSTSPTPSTATAGTTSYYVSQTNGSGCESSRATINVVVNALPSAPSAPTPVTYCQGVTASALTATGSNLLWYTVSSGGTGSSTAPTPSTASVGTTSYYVSQTNGFGCEGPRATVNVVINATPSAPTVTTPVTYCQGVTASALTATGTNLLWYTVSSGGTGSSTASTPSTATVGTTSYYVSQTNGSGCESSRATISVVVNATPSAPTVTTPITYCQGATASALTATGTNLLWYTVSSGGSGSSTAITPSTATVGTTPYYVSQTNGFGCESSRSTINVLINAVPSTPIITPSGATSFCSGCSVTLTSSAGNTYSWSSGQTTQSITVNSSGSYSVTVTNGVGCSATSSATVVTVSNGCTYTWLGTVDTDWSNSSNWGQCSVPALTNDVIIPSGVSNMPVINGGASSKNLTVQSGATLSINATGTLTLAGNFDNSGTVTENGTVVFAGSTSQSSNGVSPYANLTINNGSGVTLSSNTIVNGILTLTNGVLNSSGKLSVNLNTGAISGTGSGSITGTIMVYKTVPSTEYHFLGNPLTGFNLPFSQFYNTRVVYQYDETVVSSNYMDGWVVHNSSGNLTNLKGYAMYYSGTPTVYLTGNYIHSNSTYSISVTNTPSSDPNADGWNLLANPYPSTTDWDASSGWTKANVDNSIYMWDGANNRYASYVGGLGTNGGTQYIPSMQAFWVHCNVPGGSGSVAMNNNVRITSPVLSMWKLNNQNILKLSVASGNYSDETVIRLSEDGTNGFDRYLDAYKMSNDGNNPNFYSQMSSIDYSINTVSDTSQNIVIPVLLKAAFDGTYAINANNISSISDNYDVFLIDSLSHIVLNLKQTQTYSFNASTKDTTNRFYIVFKAVNSSNPKVTGILGAEAGVSIGSDGKSLRVDFGSFKNNEASIQVMNVLGNEIYRNDQINTSDIFTQELSNAPEGIYVIKVSMNSGIYSGKIFLK
jgi:hypothetical protein